MNKKNNIKKETENIPCRYCVTIEVYDNEKDELIINEGFNTPYKYYIADAIQKAADKLKD